MKARFEANYTSDSKSREAIAIEKPSANQALLSQRESRRELKGSNTKKNIAKNTKFSPNNSRNLLISCAKNESKNESKSVDAFEESRNELEADLAGSGEENIDSSVMKAKSKRRDQNYIACFTLLNVNGLLEEKDLVRRNCAEASIRGNGTSSREDEAGFQAGSDSNKANREIDELKIKAKNNGLVFSSSSTEESFNEKAVSAQDSNFFKSKSTLNCNEIDSLSQDSLFKSSNSLFAFSKSGETNPSSELVKQGFIYPSVRRTSTQASNAYDRSSGRSRELKRTTAVNYTKNGLGR
jgi:hypothetical protein